MGSLLGAVAGLMFPAAAAGIGAAGAGAGLGAAGAAASGLGALGGMGAAAAPTFAFTGPAMEAALGSALSSIPAAGAPVGAGLTAGLGGFGQALPAGLGLDVASALGPAVTQAGGGGGLWDMLQNIDLSNIDPQMLEMLTGGQPQEQPPPPPMGPAPPVGPTGPQMPGMGLADAAANTDTVGSIPQYAVPDYTSAMQSFGMQNAPNPPSPLFQLLGTMTSTTEPTR